MASETVGPIDISLPPTICRAVRPTHHLHGATHRVDSVIVPGAGLYWVATRKATNFPQLAGVCSQNMFF